MSEQSWKDDAPRPWRIDLAGDVLDDDGDIVATVRPGLSAEDSRLLGAAPDLLVALRGIVGCIDTSAADNGPEVTRGSMMAQVCKVLQKTLQYDRARDALAQATVNATKSP